MEIERNFLITKIPDYDSVTYHNTFDRIYIEILHKDDTSDEIIREKRITRPYGSDCKSDILTIKSAGTMIRNEREFYINDRSIYDSLERACYRKGIEPLHKISYIDNAANIVFANIDNGKLYYAEKEFSTVEEANAFEWPYPDILVREVTDDYNYRMANYWYRTRNGLVLYNRRGARWEKRRK